MCIFMFIVMQVLALVCKSSHPAHSLPLMCCFGICIGICSCICIWNCICIWICSYVCICVYIWILCVFVLCSLLELWCRATHYHATPHSQPACFLSYPRVLPLHFVCQIYLYAKYFPHKITDASWNLHFVCLMYIPQKSRKFHGIYAL